MAGGRDDRPALRFGARGRTREVASVPEEAAVRVVLNGEAVAELSASPLDLEDLAAGHLWLQGRLRRPEDLGAVRVGRHRRGWVVRVSGTAHAPRAPRPPLRTRPPVRLAAGELGALMRALVEGAALYRGGGGVHTSALARPGDLAGPGGLALLAADVGKVNTLDRLAGMALRRGVATPGLVLLTTGRLTAAMVQRGLALGCPVLVSHSGPTTSGLDLAAARGATLVGYARGAGFTAYAGAGRIVRGGRPGAASPAGGRPPRIHRA